MIPFSDPMGEALEAFQNGKTDAAITVISNIAEDDIIPVTYLFRGFEQMPELEQLALQECTGHVLDLGAGAGSHALWLQQNGFNVTALDISPKAVAVMQKRGIKNVVQADFWNFRPTEQFDTILLLMNGIGLAGKILKLPVFFAHLKTMLKPGGQILLESSDILYMFEEEDGSVVLDLNSGYYGEVEYQMAFQNSRGNAFPWLFVDFALLSDSAAEAGFKTEGLFEGENGEYLAKLTLA
ncbi:class I SAM-dependent methyltransferase [Adhaeribacter sp. BT258]|uniref:Class I SAM-dependent methyltransferase n=1 Tax=Adhaeribacter terrigena TaxID=2793070 RepID=A0ABS1C2Y8_9BACT|nr:class I SAM-dependent methyltransferase [Adhaeribacter terrigena]MBK0403767.1 class I SAM-dependent methyltransferase [Adhaeribacter terrigena]